MFTLLMVAFLALCILVALVRGGRLQISVPGLYYPIIGALIQWPAEVFLPGTWVARWANIVGFLFLIPFCWLNRRSLGLGVLLAGILLNMSVMVLNGGAMPVDAAQAAAVGTPLGIQPLGRHVPISESTVLPLLGDIMPLAPLGKVR